VDYKGGMDSDPFKYFGSLETIKREENSVIFITGRRPSGVFQYFRYGKNNQNEKKPRMQNMTRSEVGDRIDELCKELQESEGLSYSEAFARIQNENPDLYRSYDSMKQFSKEEIGQTSRTRRWRF
jgi:hypothetical protein